MTSVAWQGYELSKHLTLGVGIGIGIGLILRRCIQEKNKQRMQLCDSLERLINEVKELRESLISPKRVNSCDIVDGASRLVTGTQEEMRIDEDDDSDVYEMAPSETDEELTLNDNDNNTLLRDVKAPISTSKEFLEKIDTLLDGSHEDKMEAHDLLKERTYQFPGAADILWRYAKAKYNLAVYHGAKGDNVAKRKYIEKGVKIAKTSLDICDNDAQAHRWYAILQGLNIEYLATEQKIKMGYVYKEHIEKSIELDPSDCSSYSLLGRWCYEVFMMPWYLRKVASTLFAEPPSSTIEEALKNFLKAEHMKPGFWKMNTLYIAKCYYQTSEYAKAKEWLLKAKNIPVKKTEDEESQMEINALLGKL